MESSKYLNSLDSKSNNPPISICYLNNSVDYSFILISSINIAQTGLFSSGP